MGKRVMSVSANFLIVFLKEPQNGMRYFTVESDALPEDVRIVGYELGPLDSDGPLLNIVLDSAMWYGDSREPLFPPMITTYTLDNERANLVRELTGVLK